DVKTLVLDDGRVIKAKTEIRRQVSLNTDSHRSPRQPRQQIGFSETVEVHNKVELPTPNVPHQGRHLSYRTPRGTISHGNAIDGNDVIDCRTQFRDRRAPMTGQKRKLRTGKFTF